MRKIALAAAVLGFVAMPALAQARIRGTVGKLDGQT